MMQAVLEMVSRSREGRSGVMLIEKEMLSLISFGIGRSIFMKAEPTAWWLSSRNLIARGISQKD
jgi:hypothetical protein